MVPLGPTAIPVGFADHGDSGRVSIVIHLNQRIRVIGVIIEQGIDVVCGVGSERHN